MRSAIKFSLATAIACSAFWVSPLLAQNAQVPANPMIDIAYVRPANPAYQPIYERVMSAKPLEQLQHFMSPLKLPQKLLVKVDQCGAPIISRQPMGPATICYEYIDQIERYAPNSLVTIPQGRINPRSAILGPFVQEMLHEVSLAVFDLMQVPVWGRADDAADRLAAFVMLQFGKDVAWNTITGTAWYLSMSAAAEPNITNERLADVRGVVNQRYFTTLCMALGSDQGKEFMSFVPQNRTATPADIPLARAKGCRGEYLKHKLAFDETMLPSVDPALLKLVQGSTWLAFDETK
jgi:Putative metallopeptidase